MESITDRPAVDSFVPLSEHQSQTPQSFFAGPPVLHFHCTNASIVLSKQHLEEHANIRALQGTAELPDAGDDVAITGVEVFVTSQNLILYKEAGISIAYPSIALHALGRYDSAAISSGSAQAVILQLNLHDPEVVNAEEEMTTLDLVILPSNTVSESEAESSSELEPAFSPVKALFDALSTCADLHPDPEEAGEEDGESTIPGAGGWITAENMSEFIDSSGNFIGLDSLGPGAGSVRPRDEEEPNGTDETEDTKWQRTE